MRFVFAILLGWSLWAPSTLAWLVDAQPSWEIAILYLGQNETESYHRDIDSNILELAQFRPNSKLRLSILREFPNRWYTYRPDPESSNLFSWDPLFLRVPYGPEGPLAGLTVPGEFEPTKGSAKLFLSRTRLRDFLSQAFVNPAANRMLIVYGHGKAYAGLRQVDLTVFYDQLRAALPQRSDRPQLDIMWFNSCFMGSIEVAYELSDLTRYFLFSQDAEFASASPALDQSDIFSKPSAKDTAIEIAKRYLESYSFYWEGSQRRQVLSSSATLSVVESKKIAPLVDDLATLARFDLPDQVRRQLDDNRQRLMMTRQPDLFDLGQLIHVLSRSRSLPSPAAAHVDHMMTRYGWNRLRARKTSPRIHFTRNATSEVTVYGYNGWATGSKGTVENPVLVPDGYISGPNGKLWPYKKFNRNQNITPFAIGLEEFNHYTAHIETGEATSSQRTHRRVYDLNFFSQLAPENPILFNGSTESRGQTAEKYSGLNILAPGSDSVDSRYYETRFFQRTRWR